MLSSTGIDYRTFLELNNYDHMMMFTQEKWVVSNPRQYQPDNR